MSKQEQTHLRVVVRIRPSQNHDRDKKIVVKACEGEVVRVTDVDAERKFQVDRAFGPEASQHMVFMDCAYPLVEAVMRGINGCIFAFGQTGAGKTYSMLGSEGGQRRATQDGVLPQAATELFRRIAHTETEVAEAVGSTGFSAFEVRCSFLEVYRENVFDLLSPTLADRSPSSSRPLREDSDGRVYAEGAEEPRVCSTTQLLALVSAGAGRRATAATGVHAHSSRSHALLVLTVEHRWRDVHEKDPRVFHTRTARLTLVDLAGSETMERSHAGNANAAGISTNLGLLALDRVTRALAKGASAGHVPYRDSSLTRLLQTSLGGAARTVMLACVSPVATDSVETLSTLAQATGARGVGCSARIADVQEVVDTSDPMAGDVEDPDDAMMRRTIWIETREFGDVFARCCGRSDAPLLLYVHGSGSKNSSMFWNALVEDVTLRQKSMASLDGFYHVAIDCPGYGRSPGDRQQIRSYPGALLSSIVAALGRRSCLALLGSSQGAAAVFNAALEFPKLAHSLVVCHPVGHGVQRYSAIAQPTLLLFDVDDDGHPVSVGRQMRRVLPAPRYFEFSSKSDGDWLAKYMGAEVHQLLNSVWPGAHKKRGGGLPCPSLPDLSRLAGGLNSWSNVFNGEWTTWSTDGEEVPQADHSGAADDDTVWRALLDPASNTLVYEHVRSGRRTRVRPPRARVLVEAIASETASQTRNEASAVPLPRAASVTQGDRLFEHVDDYEDEDDVAERARKVAEEAEAIALAETNQTQCDRCSGFLITPCRLSACRHALCGCCVEQTVRYFNDCPVCSTRVSRRKGSVLPTSDTSSDLCSRISALLENPSPEAEAQAQLQATLIAERSASLRLILYYGNSAQPLGARRTSYTTYLRVGRPAEAGPKARHPAEVKAVASNPIARVDFNINPDYDKPTSSVAVADSRKGAAFEYAMGRAFPCHVRVHWKPALCLPPLDIRYTVQDAGESTRVLVVQLPPAPEGNAVAAARVPKQAVVVPAEEPRHVWVKFAADLSARVVCV